MHYGNPSPTSKSDGKAVFEFFDDFEGNSLDASTWSISKSSAATLAVTNGVLELYSGNDPTSYALIYTAGKRSFGTDVVIETKAYFADFRSTYGTYDNWETAIGFLHQGDVVEAYVPVQNTYFVMMEDSKKKMVLYKRAGKSIELGSSLYPTENVWHNIKIIVQSNGELKFYVDDKLSISATGDLQFNSGGIFLSVGGGLNLQTRTEFDYILVRKFSKTEPVAVFT